MTALAKVADREKLKPRRDPYFSTLARGQAIGFRKMTATTAGTWVARWRDPDADKQQHRPLGTFEELPASERYDAAVKAAKEWFNHLDGGGTTEVVTVKEACQLYVKKLRRDKGDKTADDVERRFKQYVYDHAIAKLEMTRLQPRQFTQWRNDLQDTPTDKGKQRTAATLNRDMTCLRGAMNYAHDQRIVTSNVAWKQPLSPIASATTRRKLALTRQQRQALVDAAAPDIALFLQVLCAIPLRPGAAAALKVADYDRQHGTLLVHDDKAHDGRGIKLPPSTAKLFDAAARNKLPSAHLFTRADGVAWNKDSWKGPVKDAVIAAGLPPSTSAYTLRHSVITDLVVGGLDLLTVAQLAGTSVRMVQEHYAHLRADHAANALAKVAL